jgi:hypothetical protein
LKKSHKPAKKYTQQFPVHLVSIIAKSVTFITSAIAATIIIISTVKSPILLYFNILNQNMFWWLTILLLVWAYAKSMVIDENKVFEPREALDDVCAVIHYCPEHWRGQGHHSEVHDEFNGLFQYSLVQLLQELLSILITPMILCFSLPNSAEKIIEFMDKITVDVEGIGHVCGFATFNFNKFGSSLYGTRIEDSLHRSLQGKMEVSYLNFKAHYPTWTPPVEHGAPTFEKNLVSSLSMHQYSQPDVLESQINELPTAVESIQQQQQQSQQQQNTVTQQQQQSNNNQIPVVQQPTTPTIRLDRPQQQQQQQQQQLSIPQLSSAMLESKDYFHLLESFYKSRL